MAIETMAVLYFFVCSIYFLILLISGKEKFGISFKVGLVILSTYIVMIGFMMLFVDINNIPLFKILPYAIVAALIPFIDNGIQSLFVSEIEVDNK